jgi:hypothetical protein
MQLEASMPFQSPKFAASYETEKWEITNKKGTKNVS